MSTEGIAAPGAAAPRAARPLRCVVVGGSLVGLSAAIALSRLGVEVTVAERSPARAADGGGRLGVDVALLREVTGIGGDPPVLHGTDRDTTAWHLLQGWLEDQATRLPAVSVRRGTQVTAVQPGGAARGAVVRTVQGDLYLSATTAMLFFAGALMVALIIIALLTLRHSPNPLITSPSKETLS